MSYRLLATCIVLAIVFCAQGRAAGLHAAADSLQAYGISVKNIEVDIGSGAEGGHDLQLRAAQLLWPEFDLQLSELHAHCPLEPEADSWRCAGQARLRVAAAAKPVEAGFIATLEHGRLNLQLNRAPARLTLSQQGDDAGARWQLQLRQLPLDWLSDLLRASWPALSRVEGQLAVDAELPPSATTPLQLDYSLRDLGFDTQDGRSAAVHLSLAGKLDVTATTPWRLRHRGQVGGGELLQGSLHLAFADHGTRLDFQLSPERDAYRFSDVVYDDPGVLELKASALVAPADDLPLRELQVDLLVAVLPQAQQRYLGSLLALAGWDELASRGRVTARAQFDADGIASAAARLDGVDLDEAKRGIGIKGLAGELEWRRSGTAPPGQLAWQSATVHSLPLGAARTQWHSHDGALTLSQRTQIPLLGGSLDLERLDLHPTAASGERLQAGLALRGVDLAALSQALGWPRFGGKLGGAVPELRYADQRLELTGGLMLNVFDGTLNVTGLALERPFGVLPSLSADIAFEQLDLSLLTGTFDIGGITGRLSGYVRALRLVDWQPVAFDAQLQALDGGRISQRAVNTISSVGGGGIAAGIQASVLKLFDTFGYARLGLGCRLQNAVCHMRGLDADGARYTLVEGRGLPRIQIVGHQSEVDWSVLVERLKAAASGTKPVIN